MDDAALVEAARGGDGAAWAAIYDRYADRLHDHCHRLLRDRDEAGDALHDAFIAASRNLHQLRDPARLRPWLYSICRHESLRRAKQRARVELTDEVDELTGADVDMDRGSRAAELQELVWSAAAGLNERDQALLDLNVRQGLEGQDLADAMGTSLSNSYVMLSRLRDQVERSLGALLIARLGREDCDELDGLLRGWDGRFSPLLRKRVARHVDGCEVCSERRAAVVSPLALLAAAPLVPAPAALRSQVLDGIGGGVDAQPISFTRAGFAVPPPGGRRSRPYGWLLAAAAALVLVVAGLVAMQLDDDQAELLSAEGTTTTTTTATTTPPQLSTTTTGPTSPSTPDLAPATTRPQAPPATTGPVIAPPTTTAPDTAAPAITDITPSASALGTQACTGGLPKTITVTATITDASAVTAVLRWAGDAGSGEVPMSSSGSSYSGTFGDFTAGGTETYQVIARDVAGNETTSPDGTVVVIPC